MKVRRSPAAPSRVVTAMRFAVPPETAWESLMFYEQLPRRPPLRLRLLLPSPTRAEGEKSAVGHETRCIYEQGDLVKRITTLQAPRTCRFDVVGQRLRIAGGIRLASGGYSLTAQPGGSTRVELETLYASPWRPRWLFRPLEAAVCRAFHRYILRAMRLAAESRHASAPASDDAGVAASGVY